MKDRPTTERIELPVVTETLPDLETTSIESIDASTVGINHSPSPSLEERPGRMECKTCQAKDRRILPGLSILLSIVVLIVLLAKLDKIKEIDNMKASIRSFQSKFEMISDLESNDSDIESLQSKYAAQASDTRSMKSTMESLQSSYNAQKSEINSFKAAIEGFQSKFNLISGSHNNDLESLKSSYAAQTSESRSMKATIESQQSKLIVQASAIKSLNAAIISLEANVTDLISEIKLLKAISESYQLNITDQSSEIKTMKALIDGQNSSLTAQASEIQRMDAILKNSESNLTDVILDVKNNEKNNKKLELNFTAWISEIQSTKTIIAKQQTNLTAHASEIKNTKDILESGRSNISALASDIKTIKATLVNHESNITAQVSGIESVEANLESFQFNFTNLMKDVKHNTENFKHLETNCSAQTPENNVDNIEYLESNCTAQTSEIKSIKSIVESMQTKYTALISSVPSSCRELNETYGITTNGYYRLRLDEFHTTFAYCDFNVQKAASSCRELHEDYRITTNGYYQLRLDNRNPSFVYCDFNSDAASSCKELNETNGVRTNGYYLLRQKNLPQPTFVYCDFEVYEDTESCDALRQKKDLIPRTGHYFIRKQSTEIHEVACAADLYDEYPYSTCEELQEHGIMESGLFNLSSASVGKYQVYCNFTEGRAITQVSHHDMHEIKNPASPSQRCGSFGCYSWTPRYLLIWNQITEIVSKSAECRQYIKARCVNEMFLDHGGYAWWVSRDGERMNYWGGATSRREKYCACGETNTCIDKQYKCNCDSNNGTEAMDDGYLTDKTKLPVTELRFGDFGEPNGSIWHTLGMLECWGKVASSCSELNETDGIVTGGYYLLHHKDLLYPNFVFCDFNDTYKEASSCGDLTETYGLKTNGYYQLRLNGVNTTVVHCDFNLYGAASTCRELNETHGITTNGYYLLRQKYMLRPGFFYCDFNIYEDVASCDALRERTNLIPGTGHYFIRQQSSEMQEIACADILYDEYSYSTCQELQDHGIIESRYFNLSSASGETYEVFCNFTEGRAITQVSHQDMHEVENPISPDQRCQLPGCYSWTARYPLDWNQITEIVSKSAECRQYLKARCVNEMFLDHDGYAWWVSRDGERMDYWGGATSRRNGYCACGETNTCMDSRYKCNCDMNNGTVAIDEGYLTDKTKLPVKELRFGDFDKFDEFIWHTLGMLECWGKAPSSCKELNETQGITTNRYYLLHQKNFLYPSFVYCDANDTKEGAASCEELSESYGISTNGYYKMRLDDINSTFVYCDFKLYGAASSCGELHETYAVTTNGYYLLRQKYTSDPTFFYCHFNLYKGASTCGELSETHGITTNGYYLLRQKYQRHSTFFYCDFHIYEAESGCEELNNTYGLNINGYYQLRSGDLNTTFVYCDFNAYEALSSCRELNETHGISTNGYYILHQQYLTNATFFYCDFDIHRATSNCRELSETYGITTNGYYYLRQRDQLQASSEFCDFNIYEDVTSCSELRQRKNLTIEFGHYFIRQRSSVIREITCAAGLRDEYPYSTCQELQEHGITESGLFNLSSGAYQVYCNFTAGKATTQVPHHAMYEIKNPTSSSLRCGSFGCYSWTPTYLLNWNQITEIVSKSAECRQYIKARCVNEMFLDHGGYAWWVSRDGERMNYWGGATSRRDKYCACGETNSCVDSQYKCNCDSNNGNQAIDEGYLTDKTKLPVRELRFGDFDGTDEYLWHTLGMLECWGGAIPMRLSGSGSTSSQGRVELYKDGSWGTVCDDGWDINDGNVVCRQLGFSRATRVMTAASSFGQGSGKILMDNVACTGRELNIWDCQHTSHGHGDCSHSEDAGVYCQ